MTVALLGKEIGVLKSDNHNDLGLRVLVAPHDSCGQLGVTARALRDVGVHARAIAYNDDPLSRNYPIDHSIQTCLSLVHKRPKVVRKMREIQVFLEAIRQYDVFHFVYRSLIRKNRDLPFLKHSGKKMVVEFFGSPVRLVELASSKNKYYREYLTRHAVKQDRAIRRMEMLAKHIDTALVGDYELYDHVSPFFKNVKIIRVRKELDQFVPEYPAKSKSNPVIVHVPSVQGIKGTDFVLKAVEQLRNDGVKFSFQLIHGVSYGEAMSWVRRCDILIDQLLLGSHGSLALEAMSYGKPVICYIRDDLVEKYPSELPIVNTNLETLESKILMLIQDGDLRHELGKKGRQYVEKYHDAKTVARQLVELYKEL